MLIKKGNHILEKRKIVEEKNKSKRWFCEKQIRRKKTKT